LKWNALKSSIRASACMTTCPHVAFD